MYVHNCSAVSLSMPYVVIKIVFVNLCFIYRPIISILVLIKIFYINRKCVLPTSGAGRRNFLLDNLWTVKH